MSTEKISGMTASDALSGSEFFEISQLIGGIRRTRRTNLNAVGDYISSYLELGTAATADVQTSATDTTAGRLMAVGAFGLGNTATPNLLDADDTELAAQIAYFSSASSSSFPGGVNGNYNVLHMRRNSAGGEAQLAIGDSSGASNRVFFRQRVTGGWTDLEAWHDTNLPDPATLSGDQTFTGNTHFANPVGVGTSSPTEKLDVDGNFKLSGYQVRGSELQEQTGGTKDNYAIGNNDSIEVALTSGTSVTFTGLAGGVEGRIVTIRRTLWSITFNHDDAGSTSTNRFNLRGNANLTLSDDYTSATFIYRNGRWVLYSLAT